MAAEIRPAHLDRSAWVHVTSRRCLQGHPVYLEYTASGNWFDVTSKCGMGDMVKAHIQSMEFCARIVLPVASRRAKRSVFRTVNILGERKPACLGVFWRAPNHHVSENSGPVAPALLPVPFVCSMPLASTVTARPPRSPTQTCGGCRCRCSRAQCWKFSAKSPR